MKRKVIQLAHKTLVVSIPSKWARAHNVKKGDEIELEEFGKGLMFTTEAVSHRESKKVDFSELESMLKRAVGALYKAGYDELEITFKESSQLAAIQDVLRKTCIGFEIVKQGKNHLLVREISRAEPLEFDNVLRRIFLFVISMGEDSLEALKEKDSGRLNNVVLMDENINRFADFCRRVLNKSEQDRFRRITPIYYIIEELERIGDNYKDIANDFSGRKTTISKKTAELYKEVNELVRLFYELFYNLDLTGLEKFGVRAKSLRKKLKVAIEDGSKQELLILITLKQITEATFDMNGALMTAMF